MERSKKRNIILISIGSIVIVLLIIYFGMSVYFRNHFYYGSEINCISVSGKSIDQVEEELPKEVESYKLTLVERDNKLEEISGQDIGLKYLINNDIKNLKQKQNPFSWFISMFDSEDLKIESEVNYDEKLLKDKFEKLACFDSNLVVQPKNPTFQYTEGGYQIINELDGNKIDKDILYEDIIDKIKSGERTVDLESINCYQKPKYTSASQEVIDVKNYLDKYVKSEIKYNIGNSTEVINDETIKNWLIVDENLEIQFDQAKIKEYLNSLSGKYDTVGKGRRITTTTGNQIIVSGGDYGWAINKEIELQSIIANIKSGQAVTKEPEYSQKAITRDNNDIGNSYVEINMSNQHLWYYKKGVLIVEGDVVTGNISRNTSTPVGVYRLKYKQKDTNLKGEGYCVPVSFWMPFNGGIGIHDAVWRGAFGGAIYRTGGSHGCVNVPYSLACTIFNNIEDGTPIVCYY